MQELGRTAFPFLAEVSRTPGDRAHHAAVDLLASTGGSDAAPLLCELIEDPDREIAVSAINQAGYLKLRQAVPQLLRFVLDDSTFTEQRDDESISYSDSTSAAAYVLVQIGDTSIQGQLVEATRHRIPLIRMCAAQILGETCGPPAVPFLSKLLDDPAHRYYNYRRREAYGGSGEFAVHQVAAKALDAVGTDEATTLLREYRKRHPLSDDFHLQLSVNAETQPKEAARKGSRRRNKAPKH